MNPINIYLLTAKAKAFTWREWKRMGGCGLSGNSERHVRRAMGIFNDNATLGEMQSACIVAGREIARFAKDHLGLNDWAVVEYEDVNGACIHHST